MNYRIVLAYPVYRINALLNYYLPLVTSPTEEDAQYLYIRSGVVNRSDSLLPISTSLWVVKTCE